MSTALTRIPARSPARSERRLAIQLEDAQLPARVAAAKIEGAAFATHVALHHCGMLSATEARLIKLAPLGEARYQAIVDSFAGYAATEIALLAHKG
jgi:hypothetical protein